MRKFLFLIGALVSVLSTASAWEKPAAPAVQALATDGETEQYIYNEGTGGFLVGDNNYYTRASALKNLGYKWKVLIVDETMPYYALIDNVERDNNGKPCTWGWRRMFCDNASAIWVDNDNGLNNGTWKIDFLSGNKFTISNDGADDQGNPIDGLLGVRDASTNDTRCYFSSAYPDENLNTTWYATSVAEYERYTTAIAIYEAAMELKDALDNASAKYPSLDLSEQWDVYNNQRSPLDVIQEAIEAVKEAVRKADAAASEAAATWSSPLDLTSSIDNPSFETGAMGAWTTEGSGGDTGVKAIGEEGSTYYCANSDGTYVFNTWGRTPLVVNQKLTDMPKGVYKLTALYASDHGNTGRLYANADTLNIAAGADKFDMKEGTMLAASTDGILNIGMVSDMWFKADHFRLMYHGNNQEGAQEYFKSAVPQYEEDAMITESLLEAYSNQVNAAVDGINNVGDAITAIEGLQEIVGEIAENTETWGKYLDKLKTAQETLQDESIDQSASAVMDLSDYLMESEDYVNNKSLTTEELLVEINKVDGMIKAAMQCLKGGADFTHFLKNPEMDAAAGWNGSPTINAKCGEKYGLNADFDVYQEVSDVPVGLYEISMQGFYREFRDDDANKTAWYNVFEATDDARTYKSGAPKPIAFVYMNSNKNPLNCVYEYAQEGFYDADTQIFTCDFYGSGFSIDPYNKYAYPNDMATAAKAFAEGAYKVSAYGIVAKDGDKLRLGVKGHLGGSDWAIFDNFKLTFRAKDEAIINKLLPDAKASLDLTGKKVGKDVKELVANTIKAAESASTVDQKFDALAKCFELGDVIEASVAQFNELEAALGDLQTAINNASSIGVAEETMTAAGTLMNAAYEGWDKGTYTDAEAAQAIKDINEMINKLKIPANIGSDDAPVDFTDFIKNADLEGLTVAGSKFGAWSWTKGGGNGPMFPYGAASSSAVEFWNGSAAALSFSLTQEITGLPVGKYGLSVQAANSYNGVAEAERTGDTGRAYLFAQTSSKTEVPSIAIEPKEDEATVYDLYKVIFTVAEGDVVTVGIKTAGVMDARWFSCDNFSLECYGANSTKQDTPDNMNGTTAIQNTTSEYVATPVGIYNMSGVKIPSLQKGLNIVHMSNGKVCKIMVK